MRMIVGLVGLVLLMSACMAGGAAKQSASTPNAKALDTSTSVPPSASPVPPVANPKGKYWSDCNLLLSDTLNGSDHLVADATIHNTGNVGIINRATARWNIAGSAPLTKTVKGVRVRVGGSKMVHFRVPVSTETALAYEDANFHCGVKVTITGTFGPAR